LSNKPYRAESGSARINNAVDVFHASSDVPLYTLPEPQIGPPISQQNLIRFFLMKHNAMTSLQFSQRSFAIAARIKSRGCFKLGRYLLILLHSKGISMLFAGEWTRADDLFTGGGVSALIDFHCRLDLFPDPEAVASAAEAAKVYVLSVTTTPRAWCKTAALSKGRPHIRTGLGIHPQLAHERSHELPLFEALLDETRYVGEISLDGSRGYGQHTDIQLLVFQRALALANERGGRIFSIHSRRAAREVIAILRKYRCGDRSVLHWFSGTPRQLAEAIDLGCWFSVGPAMLRSDRGRQLAARMPRERVLTETDGPFGQGPGGPPKPTDVHIAIDQLATIWSTNQTEVRLLLRANLKELAVRAQGTGAP